MIGRRRSCAALRRCRPHRLLPGCSRARPRHTGAVTQDHLAPRRPADRGRRVEHRERVAPRTVRAARHGHLRSGYFEDRSRAGIARRTWRCACATRSATAAGSPNGRFATRHRASRSRASSQTASATRPFAASSKRTASCGWRRCAKHDAHGCDRVHRELRRLRRHDGNRPARRTRHRRGRSARHSAGHAPVHSRIRDRQSPATPAARSSAIASISVSTRCATRCSSAGATSRFIA